MNKYLVYDIGGTEIKYGVIDTRLEFVFKSQMASKGQISGKAILDDVVLTAKNLIKSHDISGIAISSAGVINPKTGVVLNATDSIKDYIGLNIKDYLSKALNLPVSVENDVNAMALAEAILGHGKSYHHINAITIGTGIGGSIVLNKKTLHGSSFSAGEFGLMMLNGKKFEAHASMSALVKQAQKSIDPNISNGVEIFELFDKKDPNAFKVVDTFYNYLAQGISNIVYLNNPEAFIIGGGITNRPSLLDELIPYIRKHLRAWEFSKTNFYIAEFKNDAGMLGALINFFHEHQINYSS